MFRTSMLPRWKIRPTGESYDMSGLQQRSMPS